MKGKTTMIKKIGTAVLLLLALTIVIHTAGLAEKTFLMTFTGDCTLGSEEVKRGNPNSFDTFAKEKGYDYFFANFKEMFENDDLTVINLEGVLSDNSYDENRKKQFRFRGPTDFAKILTGSSIEAAGLSNNHMMDFGNQGLKSTKEALDQHGVHWFRGEKFYLHDHDGLKIAFVALDTRQYNSMRGKLDKTFRQLKEEDGANAIVVCMHAGMEYRAKHEDNYSMGNFVFGGNCEIKANKKNPSVTSLYSMVVQIRMTFTNEGKYLGQQAVIYPANISDDPVENHYQPLRLSAVDAVPVREAIQRDTAFELPELTEKDGFSLMEFPYIPDTEGTMMPEAEQGE